MVKYYTLCCWNKYHILCLRCKTNDLIFTIMTTPKYSRSNLMKSAWSMFKSGKKKRNHVLTFAECLKEAWKAEKASFTRAKSMYNLWDLAAKQEKERDTKRNVKVSSMAFIADTLVNYYASNRYNGD